MKRNFKKIGGIIGFIIWMSDYSFFLNAGGPSTRISDFLNNTFGLNNYFNPGRYLYNKLGMDLDLIQLFFPLLILVLFGMFIGLTIDYIILKINNSQK